ncbi:MAG: family 10 glycosylhydrolase [Bacteroidota bacterium]|nr:family 10 glycosylhydrolase [Bacteroidota bacterium]
MSRFDTALCNIYFLILLVFSSISYSQSPKSEVRAVWISTAGGDWPKSTVMEEQQRSLIEMFDVLHNNHFNTIFFQVRPRGNTYYQSAVEPWSSQLTRVLGKDPGWDPLAFAIEEAHKRGMELHAWFNVAKVWGGGDLPKHPQHIIQSHRDWVKRVDGEWWVDMGIPDARTYTENLVKEIAQNYDIDGIQFDFLRYPNGKFDDWFSFSTWSDGMDRSEWRRKNITTFVRDCYTQLIHAKPWLKIGSAPVGIYHSINGAQSSFTGFESAFQESRAWMRDSIQDYVAPQLYWSLGEQHNPNDPDFAALCSDWIRESYGRHVYAGIGIYRDNVRRETKEQVETTRSLQAQGEAFFRYENLFSVMDQLGGVYQTPSLFPSMAWKDSIQPFAPTDISVEISPTNIAIIHWKEPSPASDSGKPFWYVVYRSQDQAVDTRKAENILAVVPASQHFYRDGTSNGKKYFYTVTSLDRCGNESTNNEKSTAEVLLLLSRYSKPAVSVFLAQNFPDPFKDTTFISFELGQRSMVTLSCKIVETQKETVLVNEMKNPGLHIVAINGAQFPFGKIEVQVKAGDQVVTKMAEKKE